MIQRSPINNDSVNSIDNESIASSRFESFVNSLDFELSPPLYVVFDKSPGASKNPSTREVERLEIWKQKDKRHYPNGLP